MVKQGVRRFLNSAGYDLIRHYDYDVGDIAHCKIATFDHDGRTVRFAIMNDGDLIQREHLKKKFYELEELDIIKQSFAGGTFIDIGANVGNHAIYVSAILDADAVIAFEPNPLAYDILRMNIALNDKMRSITHHAVGLTNTARRGAIQTGNKHNLGRTFIDTSLEGSITLVTGDEMLKDSRADYIKIDTEGMELLVLEGLAQTIARDRPTMFVEVENHNAAGFHALLGRHGYRVERTFKRYDENENFLVRPA